MFAAQLTPSKLFEMLRIRWTLWARFRSCSRLCRIAFAPERKPYQIEHLENKVIQSEHILKTCRRLLKFEVNGQIAFKPFKDWSDYRSQISDYLMPDHDLRSVEAVSPSLALVCQLSVCLRES